MKVLVGVESGYKMTLGYAQALREAGCYLEMDSDGNVWVYCDRTGRIDTGSGDTRIQRQNDNPAVQHDRARHCPRAARAGTIRPGHDSKAEGANRPFKLSQGKHKVYKRREVHSAAYWDRQRERNAEDIPSLHVRDERQGYEKRYRTAAGGIPNPELSGWPGLLPKL